MDVIKSIFPVALFSYFLNTCDLDDITFIFDKCRCSSAEEIPDNMEVIWSIQPTSIKIFRNAIFLYLDYFSK